MGSFLHLMGWRVGFGLLSAVREEISSGKGWVRREKSGFPAPVSKDTPLPPPLFSPTFLLFNTAQTAVSPMSALLPLPPGGGGAGGAGGEGSTGGGKPQPEVR